MKMLKIRLRALTNLSRAISLALPQHPPPPGITSRIQGIQPSSSVVGAPVMRHSLKRWTTELGSLSAMTWTELETVHTKIYQVHPLSRYVYIYISQVKSAHHCVSRAVPKVWELSLVIKQILTDKAAGRCFAHRSFRKNTGQFKNLDFRISSGEKWVPWLWSLIPHPKAGSENLRGSKHSFGRPRSRR